MEVIAPITAIALVGVLVIIFLLGRTGAGRSSGIIQLSHLKCEKCGGEFDYAWIPAASFTSIRLECPILESSHSS